MSLTQYISDPWTPPTSARIVMRVGHGPVVVQRYIRRDCRVLVIEGRGATLEEANRAAGGTQ